jgi:tetratricopeptide (TPR) repeat protein
MKSLVLILIININLTFASNTFDQSKLISNFIDQEIKLLEDLKQKNINNLIRLLELYSERLGHLKSKEDQIFIEARNLTKTQAYQKTTKEHERIQHFGHQIIKNHPRHHRLGEIYYTLAVNARDFNQGIKTEFLFQKAIQTSKDNTIHYNAKSALADYYYNEKKYKQAIPLYQWSIKNAQDEWKTKNMYNLSWCYLKTNQLKLALDTQLESYELSSLPGHIDITAQALNSLPHFFVMADRSKEGLQFFLNNHSNASEAIVKMAKRASKNGEYANALYLLNQATDYYQNKKDFYNLIEIKNYLLVFYREHKNDEAHYVTANELAKLSTEYRFNPTQKDSSIEEIKSFAGLKQAYLKKNVKKQNKALVDRIISYFDILITLDSTQKSRFQYFQAETHLSQNNKLNAFNYYQQALENISSGQIKHTETKDDIELTSKIFQGLLFIVDNLNQNAPRFNQIMEYTYKQHIKLLPSNIKNIAIFNKLIAYYLTNKNFIQAETYLAKFSENHPSELSSQQSFARILIDHYIKTEETEAITTWVNQLKHKYLAFKASEIKKIEVILSRIMMKRGDQLEDTNQEKLAIELYEKIYSRPDYPTNLKADAALKLSVVYLKKSNNDKLSFWLEKAYDLFDQQQLKLNQEKITAIIDQLILKQEISTAYSLSKSILESACSKNTWLANSLFETNLSLAVLNNDIMQIKKLGIDFKCQQLTKNNFKQHLNDFSHKIMVSNKIEMQLELLKSFDFYSDFISANLYASLINLTRSYITRTDFSQALKLIKTYNQYLKRDELNKLSQTINQYLNNTKSITDFNVQFDLNIFYLAKEKSVNPEAFSQVIDSKFAALNQIKLDHDKIDSNVSLELYLASLASYNKLYSQLAQSLDKLDLIINDDDLANAFNQYRSDIVSKLNKMAIDNQQKTLKMINEKKVTSKLNHLFTREDLLVNFNQFEPKRLISSIDLK